MIMLIILDLEHYFDKRIKSILLLCLKIRSCFIRQLINTLMIGSIFRQEVLYPTIDICCFLSYLNPCISLNLQL